LKKVEYRISFLGSEKISILRTEKLCKSFSKGGVQQHVIKNLDLEIMKGNSCLNKSPLLYALSGQAKYGKDILRRIRRYRNT
jgi:hypothetical protein